MQNSALTQNGAENSENFSTANAVTTNTESGEEAGENAGENPATNIAASVDENTAASTATNPYITEYYAESEKAPGVTSITIPATVEQIDPAFFQLFPNAIAVNVAPDNSNFQSYNGMLLNADLTNLLLVPEGMEGAAVLPESLASVPAYVISRCIKLYGLIIPSGSTGNAHFATVDGILYTHDKTTLLAAPAGLGASATIAPECKYIAEGAFQGNMNLQTIVATGNVENIALGNNGAEGAANGIDANVSVSAFMPEITSSATVVTTNKSAWEAAGFTNFAQPASPGDTAKADGFVYTLLDDYTLSVGWATGENTGEGVGENAGENATESTTENTAANTTNPAPAQLQIPEQAELNGTSYKVSAIAQAGFANQPNLTEITIPASITTIGESAFQNATALVSINIPGSVATIGANAFAGCTSLATVQLNSGLHAIGASAFEGAALSDIVLPATVAAIGNRAFSNCTNLKSIVTLANVAQVSETALSDTNGVNIYVPAEQTAAATAAATASETTQDNHTWNIGPVASANHLLQYGVQTSSNIYELTRGDSVNVFENGGYIEAPDGIEAFVSYKASIVSASTTGQVKAQQLGTSAVTFTLAYKDVELTKTSCAVSVNYELTEIAESENNENEASEETTESATAEPADESVAADVEAPAETVENVETTETAEDATESNLETTVTESEEFATTEINVAEGTDFVTPDGISMIARTMSLTDTPVTYATGTNTCNVHVFASGGIQRKIYRSSTGKYGNWTEFTSSNTASGYMPDLTVDRFVVHKTSNLSNCDFESALHLHVTGYDYRESPADYREYIIELQTGNITSVWFVNNAGATNQSTLDVPVNTTGATYTSIDSTGTQYFYLNGYGNRTITFNANGGSVTTSSYTNVRPYEKLSVAPNPTRSNANFLGWYTAAEGGDLVSSSASFTLPPTTGAQTYYAHWGSKVSFNLNGGGGPTPSTVEAIYGKAMPTINTPIPYLYKEDGYKFLGWYDTSASTGGTMYYDKNQASARTWNKSTATTTLYARWGKICTVSFNINGGSGTTPSSIEIAQGESMPEIYNTNLPTLSGRTFLGWYDGSGGVAVTSGTRYYDENGESCYPIWDKTSNTTLYAHWGYKLNIVYPNGFRFGPSGGSSYDAYVDYSWNYVCGGYEGLLSAGYLNGWESAGLIGAPLRESQGIGVNVALYYDSNGNVNWYTRPANNQTLYAVYKRSGISLSANGGSLGSLKSTTAFVTACGVSSPDNIVCYGQLKYSTGSTPISMGDANADWGDNWEPTRSTYKFTGFWDAASGGTQYISSSKSSSVVNLCVVQSYGADAPTELYAQWDYARYTIQYNKNNTSASGSMASNYGYWGTNPTIKKCTFTAPKGMHFVGWNTKSDGTGTTVNGSTEADTTYEGDLSTTNGAYVPLYAQWAYNTYTIVYHNNGGTGSMSSTKATYGTNPTISKCTFTAPKNKHFLSWNTETDGSGTIVPGSTTANTTYSGNLTDEDGATVILYAQWDPNTYTISLSNKDADSNGTSTIYLKYGVGYYKDSDCKDTSKITKIEIPSRTGYSFEGYSGLTNKSGDITAANTAFTADKALDPSWEYIEYTLQLKPNWDGAKDETIKIKFTFADIDKVRIPDEPFERTNWEFREWDTQSDGSGVSFGNNSLITKELANLAAKSDTATITLFAQWTQIAFNVTFEANGGTHVSSIVVTKGELVPEQTSNRDGYTLEGWYSDEALTNKWDFKTNKMPSSDLKLYAKWNANKFTVTLDPGKGEGQIQTREYTYAAKDQFLPKANVLNFTRKGYNFCGWAEKEEPGDDDRIWLDGAEVGTGLSYGEPVTLYAQWTPITYYVFFSGNYYEDTPVYGETAMQQFTYDEPQPLNRNGFSRDGYEFIEWNTVSQPTAENPGRAFKDGEGAEEALNLTDKFEVITLFAQWKGAPYTVHFDANVPEGETVEGSMEDATFYWGLSGNLPPNQFKRSGGWMFLNWNTKPDGTGNTYADGALVRNIRAEEGQAQPTLYAQWSITFNMDVPTVDHINVTMNSDGDWITVDSADIKIKSYTPVPVGIKGVGCDGASGLSDILEDVSQAGKLVLNVNSQGTTVPLSPGTTATDSNFYFKLEEGSLESPSEIAMNIDLVTRDLGIRLKEHVEPVSAFKLTFLLGVVQD